MSEATQPHRNHGPFSDHYLDVTLPQRPGWEELIGRVRPVMEEISSVFASFTPSALERLREAATCEYPYWSGLLVLRSGLVCRR